MTSPIRLTGAAYLLTATVVLGGLDTLAKSLGGTYPLVELVWARYAVHIVLAIAIFGRSMGTQLIRSRCLRLQLFRSFALLTTTAMYFLSLQFLPLAETAAITFAAPSITIMLARPLLHERVSRQSAIAAVVGFFGVVAVIQPFSTPFGLVVLLPLGAAFASSLYAIATRAIGGRDSTATSWFFSGIAGFVATSFMLPVVWVPPSGAIDLGLLLLLGALGGGGHYLLIKAYERTQASVLAPLAYLELAWTTLLGLAVFGELPNFLGLGGIAIIAVSGAVAAGAESGITLPPESVPPPQ